MNRSLTQDEKRALEETSQMLFLRDMELTKTNEELDELLAKQRIIFEHLTDGVIIFDHNGTLSQINSRACALLEVKEDEVKGKKCGGKGHFVPPNLEKLMNAPIDDALQAKEHTRELQFHGAQNVIVEVTTVEINERGVPLGTMKILHDVTHERLVEKMKAEFLSVVSHQLRTPLTAIRWSLNMTLTNKLGAITEKQSMILQSGYESTVRMIKLVNDLLNVSRIEAGQIEEVFTRVDILKIAHEALEEVSPLIQEKMVHVDTQFPLSPIFIRGDADHLHMVMQNLFDNAVKYNKPKGHILAYVVDIKGKKSPYVELVVENSGEGIPQQEQKNLFSKFYRSVDARKKNIAGSGLGLYIVKQIVERHAGKISFISIPHKKTRVTVRLPIWREESKNNAGI